MDDEGTVVGGRYRLIRQVGEGGMATIWKAEHMTLRSPVAVKFLHTAGRTSSETTERFLREARVAASVRHRNVIEITDFGLTDDNVPYMVLEYLHGQSLAQLMEHDPALDPVEAVRIVSLTLRGLAAVHDAGIVHRDLKPENIFLVEDADGTFPKLLDFGVSRRVGLASDITQEGALIGTPDYMSPEQARGDRDLDVRTDIYAMGVILYEMISGRLPFHAERIGELIQKVVTETPPTLAELRPDLPQELSTVVQKAMARDRDERYPDARAMRWALIDAAEIYGFRHTNSAMISISELPPPPTDPSGQRKVPTGDPTLPRPAPTPSGPLPALNADDVPYSPTVEVGEPSGSSRAHAPTATAAPEGPSRLPLYLLVAVLAVGAAGSWVYLSGERGPASWLGVDGAGADGPQEPTGPEPWHPASPGLPAFLVDGGAADAGATRQVHLENLPEGAVVHVDGMSVDGGTAQLPVYEHRYRIEVHGPEGDVMWRIDHPADRNATYVVWPMTDGELERADVP